MNYRKEIKSLIISLLHEKYSYKEVVRLVHITSALAKAYLKYSYPSFLRLCTQHGMTEDDLAEDSILRIFARNDDGEYILLKSFSDSLDLTFEETSENDVFMAYQSLVHTVAIRQLVKIYSQIDSTGSRIYRNIRDSIRKRNDLIVTRDFRGLVIKPSENSSLEHLPAIPFRELEQRFISRVTKPYTTPHLLSVLFSLIQDQDSYRHSMPLFKIVRLFKRHYSHIYSKDNEQKGSIDLSTLSQTDYQIMKLEVFRTLREKILSTYVVSGKINFKEANLLYQTLVDIVSEWFNDDPDHNSYFYHANSNFFIDKDQYDSDWRTKIEYLVRIAREQLELYLIEGL